MKDFGGTAYVERQRTEHALSLYGDACYQQGLYAAFSAAFWAIQDYSGTKYETALGVLLARAVNAGMKRDLRELAFNLKQGVSGGTETGDEIDSLAVKTVDGR